MHRKRLLGCSLIATAYTAYRLTTRNRFTVSNGSGQTVRGLTVSVGGEAFTFDELAAGTAVSAHFRIGHEEVFDVQYKLADGKEVHETGGYVVWEDNLFGVDVRLTIGTDGAPRFS